jgi:FdhE protein
MAKGLFRKWLGSESPYSPELAEALAELTKLTSPSLAAARETLRLILLQIFADVGPACRATPETAAVLKVEGSESQNRSRSASGTYLDKLTNCIPLLRGEKVVLPAKSTRQRWLAVCRAIQLQNSNAQAVADSYVSLDVETLLSEVLSGRPEAVHAKAEILGLDPALTATALRFTLFPVLVNKAASLIELCRQAHWERGNCPVCGSWPLLAELRGLDQKRVLRCGLCATEWDFPRLQCPFCDEHDHRQLGFFHVEGEESRQRAATCEQCRGYVKTIFTLGPLSAPQLLVTDLSTLHLDLAAAERGYFVN